MSELEGASGKMKMRGAEVMKVDEFKNLGPPIQSNDQCTNEWMETSVG